MRRRAGRRRDDEGSASRRARVAAVKPPAQTGRGTEGAGAGSGRT